MKLWAEVGGDGARESAQVAVVEAEPADQVGPLLADEFPDDRSSCNPGKGVECTIGRHDTQRNDIPHNYNLHNNQ